MVQCVAPMDKSQQTPAVGGKTAKQPEGKIFPQIISPAVKLMSKFNFLTYLRFTLDKLANLVLSFLTKVFTCLLSSISTIGTYWYRDRL